MPPYKKLQPLIKAFIIFVFCWKNRDPCHPHWLPCINLACTWLGLVPSERGQPGRICQWSKMHCGKAWPPVLDLRSAVNPRTRWRAGRPWPQTWGCRESVPPQTRALSSCSAPRRFHQHHSQGTKDKTVNNQGLKTFVNKAFIQELYSKQQTDNGSRLQSPESRVCIWWKMKIWHCTSTQFTGSLTNLDFHKVDWLHQPRFSSEHRGVEDSSGRGDDLTSTSVDRVCVEGHVVDVEPHTSQVFVTQHALGGKDYELHEAFSMPLGLLFHL